MVAAGVTRWRIILAMDIVKTFGNVVSRLNEGNPEHARTLLKVGWRAMNLKYKYAPDKRLIPADRYLANMMMDKMLAPLSTPEHAAIVSIFMPCEMLQEAGLVPYNAEAFSCYISASNAERPMLELMDGEGISETFCSYHKVFEGAAATGLGDGDLTWRELEPLERAAVPEGTPGWHMGYDEQAEAAYLWNDDPSSDDYLTFYTYESARSLAAKLNYIDERGLGGLIVWQVCGDSPAMDWPMITAMRRGLHE